MENPNVIILPTDVHISYLPMAHIFERMMQGFFAYSGGSIGFYQGDVQKITQDLSELRPTVFASVPRLFNKFYDKINESLQKITGFQAKLAKLAIETKLKNLQNNATYKHLFYDKIIFKKMKALLGGRVKYMITSSAPISKQTLEYLKVAFCCPVYEGYG